MFWKKLNIATDHRLFFIIYSIFIVAIYAVSFQSERTQNDPDTFWHLRVGQSMIESGSVLTTALNTFGGPNQELGFIPHEIGFQLIAASLYNLGGWHGLHLLTVTALGVIIWGMFRLAEVSRQEMGLKDSFHPILHFVILIFALMLYLKYFTLRPQVLSYGFILWFVVWMRRFQWQPSWRIAVILFILGIATSNVHAGVFPTLIVFWLMCLVEQVVKTRRITLKHLGVTALIGVAAVLNADGWNTVTYILQANQFADFITEWAPVNFRSEYIMTAFVFLFIWSLMHSVPNNLFRLMFAFGVLFLGIACYKTYAFLILFLIYYFAITVDRLPLVHSFRPYVWMNRTPYKVVVTAVGLMVVLVNGLLTPYQKPVNQYPVSEMDFILSSSAEPPKVLADYRSSGYVMFRDGRVLADGRYDPFIQPESKGLRDWTAFERTRQAFSYVDDLFEVIAYDKPDYYIMPLTIPESAGKDRIFEVLGDPIFIGEYGYVWDVSKIPDKLKQPDLGWREDVTGPIFNRNG